MHERYLVKWAKYYNFVMRTKTEKQKYTENYNLTRKQ